MSRRSLPDHDVLFLYSYAAREALEVAKSRGVLTVLDQIDPGPVEFRMVASEAREWPQYVVAPVRFPEEYFARLRMELGLADVVAVNSEWSRDALIAEGVPAGKLEVLPLAYDRIPAGRVNNFKREDRRTRVLWLGQVNIRKGIQYLVEAARLLQAEPVEITVAGPVQVPREAMRSAPRNIRWLGPIPRMAVGHLYGSSDVFVLPTVSDGFAITQLGPSAWVTVIATPNCGRVVEDGANGFVIPSRSAEALAAAILKFVENRALSDQMRAGCLARAREFSVSAYEKRLTEIIEMRLRPGGE